MKTKGASLRSHVAQTTQYGWLAAATLVAVLMVSYLIPVPRALAQDGQDSSLPFGLQSGLVTAHLDPFGRVMVDFGAKSLPFGLQSGLVTAHLSSSGQVTAGLALVGGPGLPFGLQSGLATAHLNSSGQVISPFAMTGGRGAPFGLESGLVTAHLSPGGQVSAR